VAKIWRLQPCFWGSSGDYAGVDNARHEGTFRIDQSPRFAIGGHVASTQLALTRFVRSARHGAARPTTAPNPRHSHAGTLIDMLHLTIDLERDPLASGLGAAVVSKSS
jgi:hypothetical protein